MNSCFHLCIIIHERIEYMLSIVNLEPRLSIINFLQDINIVSYYVGDRWICETLSIYGRGLLWICSPKASLVCYHLVLGQTMLIFIIFQSRFALNINCKLLNCFFPVFLCIPSNCDKVHKLSIYIYISIVD